MKTQTVIQSSLSKRAVSRTWCSTLQWAVIPGLGVPRGAVGSYQVGGVHRPVGTIWLLLFPSVYMFVLGSQNANYLRGPKFSSSLKMLWDGIFLFFFFLRVGEEERERKTTWDRTYLLLLESP